jgi:hypothetical protein
MLQHKVFINLFTQNILNTRVLTPQSFPQFLTEVSYVVERAIYR